MPSIGCPGSCINRQAKIDETKVIKPRRDLATSTNVVSDVRGFTGERPKKMAAGEAKEMGNLRLFEVHKDVLHASHFDKERIVMGVVSCTFAYFCMLLVWLDQSRLYKNVLRGCVSVEKPLAQRLHDRCQLSQPWLEMSAILMAYTLKF